MFIEDLIQRLSNFKKFTYNIQGVDAFISSVIPVSKFVLKRVTEKFKEANETDLIEDFLSRLKIYPS